MLSRYTLIFKTGHDNAVQKRFTNRETLTEREKERGTAKNNDRKFREI